MDPNDINSFEDFIKFCINVSDEKEINNENFSNKSSNNKENSNFSGCNDCKFGNRNADATEEEKYANSDIPGGFQDINPQLFIIVTSVLGTVIAGNLPFNLQNVIGNWLELLGQSIISFNAQQQYFQGGPGRCYSPIYRNAANPFCPGGSDESQANISSNKRKTSNATSNTKNNAKSAVSDADIEELKSAMVALNNEIKDLKKEIEKLKS